MIRCLPHMHASRAYASELAVRKHRPTELEPLDIGTHSEVVATAYCVVQRQKFSVLMRAFSSPRASRTAGPCGARAVSTGAHPYLGAVASASDHLCMRMVSQYARYASLSVPCLPCGFGLDTAL
jgi:hypothetical protein